MFLFSLLSAPTTSSTLTQDCGAATAPLTAGVALLPHGAAAAAAAAAAASREAFATDAASTSRDILTSVTASAAASAAASKTGLTASLGVGVRGDHHVLKESTRDSMTTSSTSVALTSAAAAAAATASSLIPSRVPVVRSADEDDFDQQTETLDLSQVCCII